MAVVLVGAAIASCAEPEPEPEPCQRSRIATVDLESREVTIGPLLEASVVGRLVQIGDETLAYVDNRIWRRVDAEGQLAETLERTRLDYGPGLGRADIDGDGDLDVAMFGSGGFTVFERLGSRFVQRAVITTGSGNQTIGALADVNDDGDVDALVSLDGALGVAFGDGAFGFSAVDDLTSGGFNQMRGGVEDINGDGFLDFIALVSDIVVPAGETHQSFISVWSGQGAGVFSPPVHTAFEGASLAAPQMVDFDGDGTLDIVMRQGQRLSYLPGVGDGTFGATRVITDPVGDVEDSRLIVLHERGDGLYEIVMRVDNDLTIVSPEGSVERIPFSFGRPRLAARVPPRTGPTVLVLSSEWICGGD